MIEVRAHSDGVSFPVHVSPGAKRPSVGGEHDGALRVAVQVVAEKGKANQAVINAVASKLGVRRSQCTILSGHTSRRKTIHVRDADAEEVTGRLRELAVPG